MAYAFNNIALIGKYRDSDVDETLMALSIFLDELGCDHVFDESSADIANKPHLKTATRAEIGAQCDLAIIVGGDGSLLHTARSLARYEVPLLGINRGRLGFLVDISPNEMLLWLRNILNGKYQEEQRILLRAVTHHGDSQTSESYAFNDVVIHKWQMARMIETETYIDGRLVSNLRSDGLIIATPTGSSAYAMSSGGPLLFPTLKAMEIVPICPHTMSFRPLVIDGDSTIEVRVCEVSQGHAQVTCDGQINLGLLSGDTVEITKTEYMVRLIHPYGYDYFELLRAKLNWG